MKIIIYISIIYVSTVFCHHTADGENQRLDEDLVISSEHSRENRHEYDDFDREGRRNFEHRKTTETYKRIPAVRRVVPGEDEHEGSKHRNNDSDKRLHREDEADLDKGNLSDNESDHVNYHPQEYPSLPVRQPPAPPVVFFGPQSAGDRRQIRVPVYRSPSYSRLYDVSPIPVSYRTINPIAYSVPPRVRNVVLGYPSLPSPVRYAYSAPNSAFDSAVVPVEYRGYLAEEYDEFLKKK